MPIKQPLATRRSRRIATFTRQFRGPFTPGRRWCALCCALLVLWAAACTAVTTTPTPAPVNATPSTAPATPPGETSSAPVSPTPLERLYPLPRLSGPEFGIQAFLWWHTDNKTGWRDADLVRDLGFGWLKQQFSWTNINPFRGTYDWSRADGVLQLAQARGLKLLVRIDHEPEWARDGAESGTPVNLADFGEFCGVLAARYVGRIAAYEVWNEPNLSREWGGQAPDPAGYVEMLKTCYLAIKSTDPNAIVISAGLAPTDQDDAVAMPDMKYYRAAYAAGAAQYSDMLGVHAPGYGSPPERAPSEAEADSFWQSRVWVFRHAEDVRAMMVAAGDGDKQIAITEMGWTSDPIHPDYSWYAVDEATRAEYLVHAYQYARAHWQPWIAIMSMVYIVDPDWTEADEQYWWSITRPTLPGDPPILLPAYEALRDMAK